MCIGYWKLSVLSSIIGKNVYLVYNKITMNITSIIGREILDSRGNPTVSACVTLDSGIEASAAVPSGASTGQYEAHELRDGKAERYNGLGVTKAVKNINEIIANALVGKPADAQAEIDKIMIDLDGTPTKTKIGANAILAVSLACARAAAKEHNVPLYRYIREISGFGPLPLLPVPMMNIVNGGRHADWATDIQEYMVMPIGAENFSEALRMGTEVYHALKKIIGDQGELAMIGDEGGFVPKSEDNEAPLKLIMKAIEAAGYKAGTDIVLAIDAAAAEWYKNGQYHLKKEGARDASKLKDWYLDLAKRYPLFSIEDPFGDDDWQSFNALTAEADKLQIVGDDLYVTNKTRLERGIQEKSSNAILIKPNQIGTLTETIETINLAQANHFKVVISHRSGETEDSFIADLAVACGAGQIKTGAPARGERVAKYNRLLEIEAEMGAGAKYYKL